MLARAFQDDPVWVWALPDEAERRRKLPWVFARIVALESRRVHVVSAGGGRGVALWVPPAPVPPTRLALVRAGFPLMRLRLGREAYGRIEAFQAASRVLLGRLGYASSWFLSGLGVEPVAQRRGLGAQLVRFGLERAARDRCPAVLLTSNAANLPFYEGLGLEVVADEELPAGGPRTWALWRT